jgi:hypothetical protein
MYACYIPNAVHYHLKFTVGNGNFLPYEMRIVVIAAAINRATTTTTSSSSSSNIGCMSSLQVVCI